MRRVRSLQHTEPDRGRKHSKGEDVVDRFIELVLIPVALRDKVVVRTRRHLHEEILPQNVGCRETRELSLGGVVGDHPSGTIHANNAQVEAVQRIRGQLIERLREIGIIY